MVVGLDFVEIKRGGYFGTEIKRWKYIIAMMADLNFVKIGRRHFCEQESKTEKTVKVKRKVTEGVLTKICNFTMDAQLHEEGRRALYTHFSAARSL